jgi:hypothetical protein
MAWLGGLHDATTVSGLRAKERVNGSWFLRFESKNGDYSGF